MVTDAFLDKAGEWIDWVAISIDSASGNTEALLGRGFGNHVDLVRAAARRVRSRGIRLKINTTVTALSWNEDLHPLLEELRPDRWKVFQVLPIRGENDAFGPHGWVTQEQFE